MDESSDIHLPPRAWLRIGKSPNTHRRRQGRGAPAIMLGRYITEGERQQQQLRPGGQASGQLYEAWAARL
jgi:hypothetical protein